MDLLASGLFGLVSQVVDRVWPDQEKKAQAQIELLRMQQSGELELFKGQMQIALAQSEVNKIEAQAPDLLTRGWRPCVGWVCALALAYQMLARPLLNGTFGANYPALEMDTLLTLLFGMLGLGAFRTTEKIKGVA